METVVEFTIEDTVCRVVSEDDIVATTAERMAATGVRPNGLQVIGKCCVLGRRYLILCTAPALDPANGTLPSPRELLTPRELQVAVLVANGHGNKQIAHRLKLSEWTVSSYLRRIFVKLGVRTRAAMVARMMAEHGP